MLNTANIWLQRIIGTQKTDHESNLKAQDAVAKATNNPSTDRSLLDKPFIFVVMLLLSWGLLMVYSTTIAMPDNPRFANYSVYHYLIRHIVALAVASVACVLVSQVPTETWEKHAPLLFAASLVLLVLVLLPFTGKAINGARRWIALGPLNLQPSEVTKFTLIIYAAGFMVRKLASQEGLLKTVGPMGLAVAVMGSLLLTEPDMGAFMVITVIAMGILFLGGVSITMFGIISGFLISAFGLVIYLSPWRRDRIFAYLDPWSEEHALGKGYQLSHSLIALGRGEFFGVGLGGSIEKLHWLPEPHTDFMFAVIGEEFGLLGVIILIGLFFWLTKRIMQIGRQAIALERVFSGFVAQGIAVWIGFQSFINIGVNLGALPTKGLTLPLMSYGGSAIIMNVIAMTIVARIDYENRLLMRGKTP